MFKPSADATAFMIGVGVLGILAALPRFWR